MEKEKKFVNFGANKKITSLDGKMEIALDELVKMKFCRAEINDFSGVLIKILSSTMELLIIKGVSVDDAWDDIQFKSIGEFWAKLLSMENNLSTKKCSENLIEFSFSDIGTAIDNIKKAVLNMENQKIIKEDSTKLFLDAREKNVLSELMHRMDVALEYLYAARK